MIFEIPKGQGHYCEKIDEIPKDNDAVKQQVERLIRAGRVIVDDE
jgi:hypothetical protein